MNETSKIIPVGYLIGYLSLHIKKNKLDIFIYSTVVSGGHVPGTFLGGGDKEVSRTWSLNLEAYERDRWETGNWEMFVKSTGILGDLGETPILRAHRYPNRIDN